MNPAGESQANLNNQDYFTSKAFKINTGENNLMLLSAPSAAMIPCSAVTTAKCEYSVGQSRDIYDEETESIVAETRNIHGHTGGHCHLAKEYPTLAT